MFYKPSFPREQANRRGDFTSQGNTLEELECQTIIPIGRLYIKMLSCCYALSRAGDFYTKYHLRSYSMNNEQINM